MQVRNMFFVIFILLCCLLGAKGLECFQCSNVTNVNDRICEQIQSCSSHEYCYHSIQSTGRRNLHTLGCATSQECGSAANQQTSAIGRSLPNNRLENCHECCLEDKCNKNLCNHTSTCQDADSDCAPYTFIDFCHDIHNAKLFCRNTCGLCNLVDGQWSHWGEWGDCSVICGNGTMTRTRTCTNPAPAHRGLSCNGSSTESKSCTQQPVHGGWSQWANWSSCSSSFGVGLTSRKRLCNNPFPSRCGNHCFGDSTDYKTCLRVCSDRVVYFSLSRPANYTNGKLVFGQNISNTGSFGGDGVFTCPHPGSYFFAVNLVKKRSSSRVATVYCQLRLNSSSSLLIKVDPTNDETDKGSAMASSTAIVHLNRGDQVYLTNCTNPTTTMEFWTTFTGFLVHADDQP